MGTETKGKVEGKWPWKESEERVGKHLLLMNRPSLRNCTSFDGRTSINFSNRAYEIGLCTMNKNP